MGKKEQNAPQHIRRTAVDWIFDIAVIVFFCVFTFICIFPFYYLLINTVSDNDLVTSGRVNFYPLLKNFLDEAHAAVQSQQPTIRLRFGHDSVLLPFAYILGVDEAIHTTDDMENLHNTFALFRLIPMAGNVQWVFFRKQGNADILVKFLVNENETSIPIDTDCYPFYHWSDVESHYLNMLRDANITYKTVIDEKE